jgi:ankyrin repeat protein
MVNYLLEKGAVIEQYAIKWAARKGHLAMVELLLDNGAVMSKELLHEAVVSGNIQLVKYLIDKGAKPGDSEIKKAICDNNFELTKLLAENGAVIPNSIYAVIEELHWCKLPINSEIKEYINSYDHNANIGKQQAEVSIREDLNAEIMGQNAIYNITTHEEL